eukprot:COSAG05_NODE_243_length_13035_cov_115.270022_4_plen_82_part_00
MEYDPDHVALFARGEDQRVHSITVLTQRGAAIQRAVAQRRAVALSLRWAATDEPAQSRHSANTPGAAQVDGASAATPNLPR